MHNKKYGTINFQSNRCNLQISASPSVNSVLFRWLYSLFTLEIYDFINRDFLLSGIVGFY